MLQYVMTKLETHNINSDGQIMPNSLQNTDDGLDSGTESDDETGGPDEDMDLSDEDLQLPGPRPSSTPLYSLGSLQLEVTPTTNTMSKTDSTPTFIVTTPSSDADGGSHSSEEELEEINKTTPPLLPNSSSSSSLLSATPPGSEATPPVEFSTTPPNHVHKPRRSTSPPPCIKDTLRPCSEEPHLELRPLEIERKERRAISSKRRYRQSRIHHIQRPCLDFEKMQLLKTRAVTSWRHGGELSLFCW